MTGGVWDVYHVDGLPETLSLTSQDCRMHMETKALTVIRKTVLTDNDRNKEDFSHKTGGFHS